MFVEHSYPHKLIVLEGIDGTGKSLLAKGLTDEIKQNLNPTDSICEELFMYIYEKIKKWIDLDDFVNTIGNKQIGEAVVVDHLKLKNPMNATDKENMADEINPNASYMAYLVSAQFKQKIIHTLLPHFHVICDRYVHSVIARHKAMRADLSVVNLKKLAFIRPDIVLLLLADEEVRQKRLSEKPFKDKMDRLKKTTGSLQDIMEKQLTSFSPVMINTTHQSKGEVRETAWTSIQKIIRQNKNDQ